MAENNQKTAIIHGGWQKKSSKTFVDCSIMNNFGHANPKILRNRHFQIPRNEKSPSKNN
ncbi:hypothetical protein HMPREF0658_2193 [Hoylesella marshii DSM 16973 = JCM 13450]|uniref:Uncharacterized protein n=1 Tax=Hoylesella marshii DSM 16973 = JCM 13450 TaxID=862515 RepID=E0NVI8_9BACT|nr:hypothetical protein HMPREF0658_2193 [Hoylesella marshii DSM 16973 = JCM 13450]